MKYIQKTLKAYGLTNNEILVYLEALKHEESSPYLLAKLTGIPRTTVYDVMTSLSLKKLITLKHNAQFEKRQTKIVANNPSVLRKNIWKKKNDLTSLELDILDILPELKGDYYKQVPNADLKFYPGVKGAEKVLFSETKGTIDLPTYVWTNLMPMDAFGINKINKSVERELHFLKKAKYPAKKLIPLNDWTKHVLTYQFQKDPGYIKYREFKYIEHSSFDIQLRIIIKGNTVRMVSAHENEIWGMIARSKSLATSLSSIFLLNWAQAKDIDKAFVQSLGENEFAEAERIKRKRKT